MEAKLQASKRSRESSESKYYKLEQQYQGLLQDNALIALITVKLEEYEDLEHDGSHIRHNEQR